jgi:hypothetical protein
MDSARMDAVRAEMTSEEVEDAFWFVEVFEGAGHATRPPAGITWGQCADDCAIRWPRSPRNGVIRHERGPMMERDEGQMGKVG